jgi:NitT/TauT family transport system substrate-binding protein
MPSTRTLILLMVVAVFLPRATVACVAPTPQVVEKEVIVTKEVEVEKEVLVEPDYVTLRTNWIFNGVHAHVFYGKNEGFFRDEGIVLDIREGNGSGNVVRTIMNKSDDFAMVSVEPVFAQMAQGAPIKFIFTWDGAYGYGYVCNPDSGVETLEDLKDKVIITSPGAASITIHDAFQEHVGIELPELTLVDPGAAVPTVLGGRADCELSGWTDQVPIYRAEGVEPSVVKLADYGFGGALAGIITHQDTIDNNPDLVRRMLRALRRSMDECWADKEACTNAMLLDHPMFEYDVTFGQLDLDSQLWKSPKMECFGQFVVEEWEAMYDLVRSSPDSGIEGDRPVTDFIDDRFVPACQ